ncbi:MAG TPA: glycosyltransferase family 4 protein [Gemmatimonadales bacterium]|nr:glycosyltransferase family 4 protein [Gemmatimonadales bacterium]
MGTARRPRILFLAQCLPYPPHTGVAARTFNILLQLQKTYDVDLVAFYRVNHQPDRGTLEASWEALRRVVSFVAEPTPIPSEHSTLRKLWVHARSMVSGRVYTFYEYDSRSFAERLRSVIRSRRPDIVHLDSLDMHRWLPELPPVPITCTHHDIDSDLLRRRARLLGWGQRQYLLLQAKRIERLERALCPRFALNVMMSELDARKLRALAPEAATVVVQNGTNTDYFQPTSMTSLARRVAFVGPTFSSQPNRDAVEFLLQQVWPLIRAGDASASLQLIGRHAPADHARYSAEPGVQVLGQIPDIRPALAEAGCCIVPMRIGGGTRLKILDAWSMGKAVVSTAIGCEGLEAVDGENIIIRDTPAGLAQAVVQILGDFELRRRLEQNGRRTVVAHYSWDSVGERLRSAYSNLRATPLQSATTQREERRHGVAAIGARPNPAQP